LFGNSKVALSILLTIISVLTLLITVPVTTNASTTIIQQEEGDLAQTDDDNSFKIYQNPTYGINIQYPSNWRIDEGDVYADDYVPDIVSFIASVRSNTEAYAPSLSISIDNPPPNLNENLNEYLTRITSEYIDTYEDFKVIESDTNSILSGKPAYMIVFTDEEDSIDYKSMEIGTIIGDKVYFVTYYAEEEQYSNYLPTVQEMISSVKMTRSSGGLETNSPTTAKDPDKINPSPNQPDTSTTTDDSDEIDRSPGKLTDRYYEGLDWRGICSDALGSGFISQPCDTLITPDGNALTSQGKQVMEGALCPRGQGVIKMLEFIRGPIPDHLESELTAACDW
jgi:hypothetical protein